MNYYRNDIKHNKGDTYSSGLVIEGLGQTVDTIYFTCRENLNDNAEVLFQSGLNDGISQVEYDEENDIRKYAIRVAPSKTKNLQSGTYYYDLEVGVNSDTFTIMKGKFILEQDATREDNGNPIILKVDQINGEVIGSDIEDKLDYLEDTKSLMKDMINELGGELTDNDTFRSYVDEIYNIYPKAKGQGTNITLNNTKVAKMELEIVGAVESVDVKIQNKNLFNGEYKNLALWSSSPNVDTTFAGGNSNYVGAYTKVEAGKTYSVSRQVETNRFVVTFSVNEPTTNGTTTVYNSATGNKIENITIPNGFNYLFVYLSNSGEDTSNVNLMIEEDYIATEYISHQEQNITLPLGQGEYAYSYDDVTNVIATSTIKATALMKGDE